jgi:hypothetical protein
VDLSEAIYVVNICIVAYLNDFATFSLSQNPKDKTAKNVVELLNIGADLPKDIYPLLKLD